MTKVNMLPEEAATVSLLLQHRLMAGLDAAIAGLMAQGAQAREAMPGDILFREGDEARSYLLLESGEVEVFRYSHHGDERVFHVFEPGQLVAEAAMFMPHGRYPMWARARTACRLFRLQRSSLHQACQSQPALAMSMLAGLSSALYGQVNKVDWITSSSAAERLANYLLQLKERQGTTVQLPLNQRQLAAHLGMRAETLSRLFTEWQARGYVTGRRCDWKLHDLSQLQRLASLAQRPF
ncbi:Crp/Fnr family transcriptional regulator [Pusillimonas sp. ANT_WB101]|uniref:Crp/Fnr family transcriptional regulator n=1 Tax=Pusillimonas sp. ANT_WB101 TaxID=2597356 RepID=UPI0011ECCC73|nr:Crp/Fnr family transcriptional regulator [Pusillimonas sp. ANT_WB101]KAA0892891.1 Crp/Fnr family transcriptional regulator [Pusillimonas sp. ANT_WB101]